MSNDGAFEDGQRLMDLKQTGTTRKYAKDFRAIASRVDWNNAALNAYFYEGLSSKVKDIIYLEERPGTLEEYIHRAETIDDRLSERKEEKRITSRQGKGIAKKGKGGKGRK